MKKHIPLITASIMGLLMGNIVQQSAIGVVIFAALGALGGHIATRMPKGSERMYWGFVLVTLGLWIGSITFLNLAGSWLLLPMPITLGYFTARLISRFTGGYKNLPLAQSSSKAAPQIH